MGRRGVEVVLIWIIGGVGCGGMVVLGTRVVGVSGGKPIKRLGVCCVSLEAARV